MILMLKHCLQMLKFTSHQEQTLMVIYNHVKFYIQRTGISAYMYENNRKPFYTQVRACVRTWTGLFLHIEQ